MPRPEPGDWSVANAGGLSIEWQGALERLDEQGGLGLRATGEHEIRALGLRLRLERDEEVRFRPLGQPAGSH
jgi:hypothetical protein